MKIAIAFLLATSSVSFAFAESAMQDAEIICFKVRNAPGVCAPEREEFQAALNTEPFDLERFEKADEALNKCEDTFTNACVQAIVNE